jgi:hypothetical protein
MKPKYKKTAAALLIGLLAMQTADATELTGDVRLACEAILCLSSSVRPGECNPALSRYYGINKRRWSDTVSARLSFLNLCPTAGADRNMQTLVSAIASGAGRCGVNDLNMSLRWSYGDDRAVISNVTPSYCSAWYGHSYTDLHGIVPVYVGEPDKGVFWTEPQNFEASLKIYNDRLREAARRYRD